MNADLRKICIPSETSIVESIRVLNDGHKRIVLVVDPQDVLLGVISDSDIRRAVLGNVPFHEPVSRIMASHPVVVRDSTPDAVILELMRRKRINEIPVVDEQNRVVGLRTIDMLLEAVTHWEAVIMAGGVGKRLMPLTAEIPKPLLKVGEKPILFILLDQLIQYGCAKVIISVNYLGEQIVEEVQKVRQYADLVEFVWEKAPLGTAGSLSLIPRLPEKAFLVLNGDVLTQANFRAMLDFHRLEANRITVAIKEEKVTVPYGVVQLDSTRVIGMKEKPNYQFFVNAGIYVLDPGVISQLERDQPCDMTDLIDRLLKGNERVGSFPVHEYWRDVGQHEDFRVAQDEVRNLLN
jgi:dTDP-glucose pyrophosphorylase